MESGDCRVRDHSDDNQHSFAVSVFRPLCSTWIFVVGLHFHRQLSVVPIAGASLYHFDNPTTVLVRV